MSRSRSSIKGKRIVAALALFALLYCAVLALPPTRKLLSQPEPGVKPTHPLTTAPKTEPVRTAVPAPQPQTSNQFNLSRNVIAGGGGTSSGGSFTVDGTIGQSIIGASGSGSAFNLAGGFWPAAAGATCAYSISPSSQNFSASGGAGSVNITAEAGCPWTAVSNDAFITITSVPAGAGLGTVNYTVTINGSTTSRSGTLTIAGQTFTVKQEGAALVSPTVQFSSSSYIVNEADGRASVIVNRTNATNAATINYATTDLAGLNECSTVNGIASQRCDYATSVGTLRFAAGESSKTISIPVVDDSYAEGREGFSITLSNPTGATLGSPATAFISISDNESSDGTNPINQTSFFVRQHYIDFLGREPDPIGFQGWQDTLNNCAAGDKTCDRIEVSSGFFRSAEFQERGYFTYRFYSVALGRKPDYAEFMPDLAKVSGFLSDAEKEANKVAFVDEFMARTAFKNRYDSHVTPTAYVDALLATAGLPNHPSRAGWIAGLQNGTLTRGQVLRQLAESAEAYNKFYNEAFVVMQYFGYLRRDPDIFYLDWISEMNKDPNNYRAMVDGFMNSVEYRRRFGL